VRPILPLLVFALGALAGCSSDEAPAQPETKLLIVGWDGATFDLIDPLLAAGRLPNLAGLIERGQSARLASTIIPISSAAWVGAVTGKGPGASGVYSFFEPVAGTYDVQPISSRSNRAHPLWRILSAHGIGVQVFGVPITYPPEPVLGTMVAGMLSPFDADYAWPPEYTTELRGRGFVPDLGIWKEEQELKPKKIERQLLIKERAVCELLERDAWSFSMVVFKNLDVLAHRAYDPHPQGDFATLVVQLDATLGQLLASVPADTNVIVMSDHGFALYPRAFNLHSWLVEAGFSQLSAQADRGALAGTLDVVRVQEHARRLGELELPQSRAFATACEGNFGSLRLNVSGREPHGVVPAEQVESVLNELESALRSVRFEGDDQPLVTAVHRGSELYPGPHRSVVPDLLIEVRPDVQVVAATTHQPTFVRYERPRPDHARSGILVMAGPDVAHGTERGDAEVFDIAPTALYLLDRPVYAEMHGSVLSRLLSKSAAPVVISEADDTRLPPIDTAGNVYSDEARDEVRARLKAMGYF